MELPSVFSMFELCKEEDLHVVIVTFLSVLDLLRQGFFDCEVVDDEIYLKRGVRYGK